MPEPRRSGLLVDYGGVLTSSLFGSFATFCETEGLEPDTVRNAFRGDRRSIELLVEFECGRLSDSDFERHLAERLGVKPVGLIGRMFGHMSPDQAMLGAVASAKAAGIRTGLLSNSWGASSYDRTRWPELFDALVISGEEGMRKPDPRIYRLAAERMQLLPEEIVFVDDLAHNLEPARELGMATVHHTESDKTLGELERLFGLQLGVS